MHKRRSVVAGLAGLLILACSCPLVGSTGLPPAETATPAIVAPNPNSAPTTEPSPEATTCTPQVSANSAVNVRGGPGVDYDAVAGMEANQVAEVAGRNADSSWWYINLAQAPNGHGWVAASVTTAICIPPSLAIVAAPPTPIVPTDVVVRVTDVSVSIDPTEIHVGGCVGPIQPSTATATITVNGPIKLNWHFVTQQNGALSIHSVNFMKASSKDVSESFTPPVTAGTYWVRLEIQGQDLSGMGTQVKYKIIC